MDKINQYNISMDLVSYMTGFLSPFMPYDDVQQLTYLEASYNKLLNQNFRGDAMLLLQSITYSCKDIIDFCLFGFTTLYSGQDCCQKFFRPLEFGFVFSCWRSNAQMVYTATEPSILTGIMIGLRINDTVTRYLNKNILNRYGTEY
jgi:hypothetical protein